jgi:hypothetical protein
MTPAEPPRSLGFTPEGGDRLLPAEQSLFRATAMVIAPVSAYRRPLGLLQPAVKIEPVGKPAPLPGGSPRQDDLDEIMVKLKAAAASAEQLPRAGFANRHLVIAAAIALSMISGAVTAQFLVPGHPRPSIAQSTGK